MILIEERAMTKLHGEAELYR